VGFKDSTHGSGALDQAFAMAGARGARLTVIHAWELPSVYDDIIVRRTHDEDWNVKALDSIGSRIAGLRKEYPGVVVDVEIAHAQPAHALVEAATGADLLLIERRGGRLPSGFHLGGTARAMLREAPCPIEILPPHGSPVELEHLDLESAGVPLK
jgi:nucleotide-binding universal stress UspA family protein